MSNLIRVLANTNTVPRPPIRAIVTGSTGTLGYEVLHECLKDPRFESVTALTRRDLDFTHPKLNVIKLNNFLDYSGIEEQLRGHHVCYWCLGVSTAKVSDEKKYREITLDYTIAGAQAMSRENPNFNFFFVSGGGADPTMKSRILFARVKGETENKLNELGLPRLIIWRPGYIAPLHKLQGERIFAEKAAVALMSILKPILPSSLSTDGAEVSRAFFHATFNEVEGALFENKAIKEMAKKEPVVQTPKE